MRLVKEWHNAWESSQNHPNLGGNVYFASRRLTGVIMLQSFIVRSKQVCLPLLGRGEVTEATELLKEPGVSTNWELLNSPDRYFVSCYRKLGVLGWIYYTKTQPVKLTEEQSERDVSYLIDLRRSREPHVFIDTPANLVKRLGGVDVDIFANPTTVETLRSQEATRYIETLIEDIPHPETVFLMWLRAQMSAGLTELCGIVLQDHTIDIGSSSKLNVSRLEKRKQCEPGEFLKFYQRALIAQYQAMPKLPDAVCIGGWRPPSLAELARGLLKQQTAGYLGLSLVFLQNDTAKLSVFQERNSRAMESSHD
jgi:hypothetical protein